MTRLERGATGFWRHGDEPLPDPDVRLFRTACREAARRIRGCVDEPGFEGGRAANFQSAAITGRVEAHVVVGHRHLPVIAFTDAPPVPGRPLSGFVDPPLWVDSFEAVGFRSLPVRELSTPMSRVDVSELAEAELARIRQWRPEVLSDVLFDWWD